MSRNVISLFLSLVLVGASVSCGEDDAGTGGSGDNLSGGDAGTDLRNVGPGADMGEGGIDFGGGDFGFSGEECTNGVDDDNDTLIDCADPDCNIAAECEGGGGDFELLCDDGLDDDGDGRFDCNDPDCSTDPACEATGGVEVCDNEADDDNDGLVDCFDGDCAADPVCRPSTAEICDNSIDDDDDMAVDCDDADCETFCNGGGGLPGGGGDMDILCAFMCLMDPDLEGCLAACLGGGGGGGGETDCDNGVDDDGNGTADCDDLACILDPACGF